MWEGALGGEHQARAGGVVEQQRDAASERDHFPAKIFLFSVGNSTDSSNRSSRGVIGNLQGV